MGFKESTTGLKEPRLMADNPIRALPTEGIEGAESWLREHLDRDDVVGVFAVVVHENSEAYTVRGEKLTHKDLYWLHRVIDNVLKDD